MIDIFMAVILGFNAQHLMLYKYIEISFDINSLEVLL